MVKACGNHSANCGYRFGKLCKKPKEFKCKYILKWFEHHQNEERSCK